MKNTVRHEISSYAENRSLDEDNRKKNQKQPYNPSQRQILQQMVCFSVESEEKFFF